MTPERLALLEQLSDPDVAGSISRYVVAQAASDALAELDRLRALMLGKRQKLLVSPPHVEMLRVDNVRTQRITHAQYKRLIKELRTPEKWAAILAYHTGWRLGRVLDLKWSQVDFEAMVINPPERQTEHKRVGRVPIYGDMVYALLECQKRSQWTYSEYVVHRTHGGKLVDIKKPWRKAVAAAGLSGLRFHDLRACAASNLIDAGVPQVEAMAILGHQTPSMFQRYRIDSPKRLRDIGAQMEGVFTGRREGQREGDVSNKEAADLALSRGQKWRLEIFDAQLGGSITLYYSSREAVDQASCRAGGWVQRHDGRAWVSPEKDATRPD